MNNTPKLIRMLELFVEQIKIKINDLYVFLEKIKVNFYFYLKFIDDINGVFTHYFLTIFTCGVPVEYANRVMDLFWIYEEKIIFDCLIHLLKLKKELIFKMQVEVRILNDFRICMFI